MHSLAITTIRAWLVKRKAAAYRLFFRHIGSKFNYPLIEGKKLQSLRKILLSHVEHRESICNAGLVRSDDRYVCVAKNQRFSLGHEMGVEKARNWLPLSVDDDRKILYRIVLDRGWQLSTCERLEVFLDGRAVTPEDGVEDVRLLPFKGEVWAYATGSGNRQSAWPLYGKLNSTQLTLRSARAAFSAPQKNWMPFEVNGTFFLEYSIDPHVILEYDRDTAECRVAYRNERRLTSGDFEIHGGAPALRLNHRLFLGVGNSQHRFWYQERYYAPVFYLFEAEPPFKVIKMTKPLRIQSHTERVHYVTGMTFSEDRQSLIVSIGICDYDNRFVAIPLEHLLKLLN